jgi:hypothetical protein
MILTPFTLHRGLDHNQFAKKLILFGVNGTLNFQGKKSGCVFGHLKDQAALYIMGYTIWHIAQTLFCKL